MATEMLNFRKKYKKICFSEVIRAMKLKLCINVCVIMLYIKYVFIAVAHAVFVAMTALSFHNGKSECRPLFLSDFRYFDKSFTVMFLE